MAIIVPDRKYANLGIAVSVCFLLYVLGFTSFFFVLPLLIFFTQSGQRDQTLISLVVLLIAVLLFEIIPVRNNLSDPTSAGLLSIGLFLPIVLVGSSIIWVLLSYYRLLVRYIGSSIFIIATIVAFGLFLKSHPDVSKGIDDTLVLLINNLFNGSYGHTMDTSMLQNMNSDGLYIVIKNLMIIMLLPSSAAVFGFNAFISIASSSYVGDTNFDERVASWKLPETLVWFFLASWLIVLFDQFIGINNTLRIGVWNVALFLGILYAVQGLSIILFKLNAKGKKIRAVKLFMIVTILTILLQGLNIGIVLGLPILGVTETWFTYRK